MFKCIIKNIFGSLLLLSTALFITACGSTTKSVSPLNQAVVQDAKYYVENVSTGQTNMPEHLAIATKSYIERGLNKHHKLAKTKEEATHFAMIDVLKYRMRTGFTRSFFGVLAGGDQLQANIRLIDRKSKQVIGESVVNAYNVTAHGSEDDIPRYFSESVTKFLLGNATASNNKQGKKHNKTSRNFAS